MKQRVTGDVLAIDLQSKFLDKACDPRLVVPKPGRADVEARPCGAKSSADQRPRLDYRDPTALFAQRLCDGESGDAGADHNDIDAQAG
jgi:hypothetical protein